MAHTRTLETHKPSGETHVVERDDDGRIVATSHPLYYSEWQDPNTMQPRADLDLNDFEIVTANDWTTPESLEFLAGFDA